MDLVKWCNENQGFVTAIFSFSTVLISVVAISLSINVARFQTKKKLRFKGYFELNDEIFNIYAIITNVGNRNINIIAINIHRLKDNLHIGLGNCEKEKSMLSPQSTLEVVINIFDSDIDKDGQIDINKLIYFVCYDSEGKKYIGKNCFDYGLGY